MWSAGGPGGWGRKGVMEEALSESVLQNEQDFRRQIWPFVSYMSHPSTCLEFLFHLLLREQFLGNTHFLPRDGEKVAILFVQCFFHRASLCCQAYW